MKKLIKNFRLWLFKKIEFRPKLRHCLSPNKLYQLHEQSKLMQSKATHVCMYKCKYIHPPVHIHSCIYIFMNFVFWKYLLHFLLQKWKLVARSCHDATKFLAFLHTCRRNDTCTPQFNARICTHLHIQALSALLWLPYTIFAMHNACNHNYYSPLCACVWVCVCVCVSRLSPFMSVYVYSRFVFLFSAIAVQKV